MELGFETIGNATVICHDRGPVLVTDPWVTPQAYFGSWTHTHEIPEEQMAAIDECEFVWFSHGHPDHLNPYSVSRFQAKKILLSDHHGDRIRDDLRAQGFDVTVLKDREWTAVSEKIKVLSIADDNQDAILLIDIGGTLLVNTNDASHSGWGRFVRKTVAQYKRSFRLAISGVGEADMCNFFDEDGERILFLPDVGDVELGQNISRHTDRLGIKYFIPFSSMHKYQREDSIWANRYVPSLGEYAKGYSSDSSEILPAYVRYDLIADKLERIDPPEIANRVLPPEHFGDNWGDPLAANEVARAKTYFGKVEHLTTFLDFINLRVGGEDNIIELRTRKFDRGITFEAPRKSLMTAITGEIFDDLMIANFVKTTLHGKWGAGRLYPDFTPYVAKIADNGRAHSAAEVRAYRAFYRSNAPVDHMLNRIEQFGINKVMTSLSGDSKAMIVAKSIYNLIKRQSNRKVEAREAGE